MNKLTINLVTYNGGEYLPFLFNSLKKQTYKDWKLNVQDNCSNHNTLNILKNELNNLSVQYDLKVNTSNIGFSKAHNQLWKDSDSQYVLLLNDDVILEPDCLEKMIDFMNEKVAVVSPRLMQWKNKKLIDSLGLKVLRNRRVVEIGVGKEYTGDLQNKEVFGVSATCALYRKNLVDKILYEDNLFDETYICYKEDIDLSYRLQQIGTQAYTLLNAVAYHDRSGFGLKNKTDIKALKNKTKQAEYIKYHSYKNHLATLYKNEYLQNFLLDFPWIFWYEFKKFIYFLLFDRNILKGLKDLAKIRKELRKKRKQIKSFRSISWKKMRKWW